MPITKDSPLVEIRKKLVKRKESKNLPEKEVKTKPIPTTIPSHDFDRVLDRAETLCDALIATKKTLKPGKDLPGSYKRSAKELGDILGSIVSTIKSTASVVMDSQVRARLISESKVPLPVEARKAANSVLKLLGGSHRRIKQLNTDIGYEIKKSQRGIEPKTIKKYLPEIREIYSDAESARIEAARLYKQWSPSLTPGGKVKRRLGMKTETVQPKFGVHSEFVKIGTPKTGKEKKLVEKINMVASLGGEAFPDAYTSIWKYFGTRDAHIDDDTRNIIRIATQYSAKKSPFPKQHTILELFETGIAQKRDDAKFDTAEFNANFDSVVNNILKKMNKDPKCKEFVFKHYERADGASFERAINHLGKNSSRGSKLLDNARRLYVNSCREWFTTYLPQL